MILQINKYNIYFRSLNVFNFTQIFYYKCEKIQEQQKKCGAWQVTDPLLLTSRRDKIQSCVITPLHF